MRKKCYMRQQLSALPTKTGCLLAHNGMQLSLWGKKTKRGVHHTSEMISSTICFARWQASGGPEMVARRMEVPGMSESETKRVRQNYKTMLSSKHHAPNHFETAASLRRCFVCSWCALLLVQWQNPQGTWELGATTQKQNKQPLPFHPPKHSPLHITSSVLGIPRAKSPVSPRA